jgi:hypothetical protein
MTLLADRPAVHERLNHVDHPALLELENGGGIRDVVDRGRALSVVGLPIPYDRRFWQLIRFGDVTSAHI